mmetsp:Transcript_7102/g.12443  ORF Transcript_7102/g.12443 Transcript_7102/m.12443 type:complete len:421 (-) Transcript_7102:324-1586(-)
MQIESLELGQFLEGFGHGALKVILGERQIFQMAILPDGIDIRQIVLLEEECLEVEQLVQRGGQRPYQLVILEIEMLQIVQQRKFRGHLPAHQPLPQLQSVRNTLRHINLNPILPSHLEQFLNPTLQLILQLLHILAKNALPFALVHRTPPLQPTLHRSPRPADKVNHHERKPLMQVILRRAQLHSILVHQPLPRAMMRRLRIQQRFQSPRGDFREAFSDGLLVETAGAGGTGGGFGWFGGCHVGYILGDQCYGDGDGDDDYDDEATSYHEGAAIDEVPNTSALEFFVRGGFFVDAIIGHVHHIGVHFVEFLLAFLGAAVIVRIVLTLIVILGGARPSPILLGISVAAVDGFGGGADACVGKSFLGVVDNVPRGYFLLSVLVAYGGVAFVFGAASFGLFLVVPPLGFGGVDGCGGIVVLRP